MPLRNARVFDHLKITARLHSPVTMDKTYLRSIIFLSCFYQTAVRLRRRAALTKICIYFLHNFYEKVYIEVIF